jgi:hypothetical protein
MKAERRQVTVFFADVVGFLAFKSARRFLALFASG